MPKMVVTRRLQQAHWPNTVPWSFTLRLGRVFLIFRHRQLSDMREVD